MLVVSRAEWGARHENGFGPAPLPAREVWLHHSAGPAPAPDGEHAAMRALEQIGHSRFGRGISYTWAVMPSGRVYEGHGVSRMGSHTAKRNSIARAICLVGNYDVDHPTDAQVAAVVELLREGETRGWWRDARLAGGHRDAPGASTACPGRHAQALIGEINRRTAGTPDGPESLPTLRRGDCGPAVAGLQRFLNRCDWTPDLPLLVVDGVYGIETTRVVAAAQAQCGVTGSDADGSVVGPRTTSAFRARGWRP